MATGDWITVGFVPATASPLYSHKVNPRSSGDATLVDEVVGWLVQQRYTDEQASPINSRVVAGVVSDGEVFPAKEAAMFLGVYPEGEAPSSHRVEAIRQSG